MNLLVECLIAVSEELDHSSPQRAEGFYRSSILSQVRLFLFLLGRLFGRDSQVDRNTLLNDHPKECNDLWRHQVKLLFLCLKLVLSVFLIRVGRENFVLRSIHTIFLVVQVLLDQHRQQSVDGLL